MKKKEEGPFSKTHTTYKIRFWLSVLTYRVNKKCLKALKIYFFSFFYFCNNYLHISNFYNFCYNKIRYRY